MTLRQIHRNAALCTQGLLILGLTLIAVSAVAQDATVPKVDIFVGYQFLNPDAKVPVPGT